ncbi:tyrosine-type recombinase/integrase [Corynebacterium sp. AOP34-AQ2-28]|uniref:tyrosine-type recombinase/integrase n=1 Tax=Corynebacterium sp. AOP34-AQ2-28 TaxID=3457689 RepID=UPI0040344EAA
MPKTGGERRAFGEKPWHNGKPKGKGRRYYGRFSGPDGERYTAGTSFETPGAVEAWYLAERRIIDRMVEEGTIGEWLPPRARAAAARADREARGVTVAEVLGRWIDYKTATSWEESTRQTNVRQLNLRLLEVDGEAGAFRAMPASQVTRRDANAWWEAVWAQFPDTAPTNNGAKKHLTAAFKWAARQEIIPANPVDLETRRAKVGEGGTRKSLPELWEVKELLAHVPERYRFPTALALVHGLRTQEVLGLRRWQVKRSVAADGTVGYIIDLSDRGRVRAAVRLTVDGKQTMVDKGLKTEASYREVPVFPDFVAMCEAHMDLYAGEGDDGLVALTNRGTRVMDTSWNTTVKRAAKRAGLRDDIHKHDGRRFAATALSEVGVSETAVGAYVGDKSGDVLRKHYLRHSQEHLSEGVERMGDRLRGVAPTE